MTAIASSFEAASRRWHRRRWAQALIRLAVVSLLGLSAVVTGFRSGGAWPAAVCGLAALGVLLWSWRCWRPESVDTAAIAQHLDRTRPELEDSSELVLTAPDDLPLLARLQRERILGRLPDAEAGVEPPALGRAWVRLALAAAVALLLPPFAARVQAYFSLPGAISAPTAAVEEPAAARPAIERVEVSVAPPAYTGRDERGVDGLDVEVEAGSRVRWRIEVSGEVASAALVFDERDRVALDSPAEGAMTASRTATETHLYRLELMTPEGEILPGNYARFEVVPDEPPVLSIVRPERFVELQPDRGQILEIAVEATDDYGLGTAALVATVASGFGELVEFRERRLEFDSRRALEGGGRSYQARLDLDALGVSPGSEIFFFAEGTDRRRPSPQTGRSATHIVRLPGDTSRSVGLASRLPILRVPEFFRSQRQIILDTERLLVDEPTITAAEFRRRAESLGFDQRALRLRYGGLLGEEFESGRPAGVDEDAEEHDEEMLRLDEMEPGGGGGREDVREALESLTQGLAHQHDSSEISTYFDSEIKAQLKAALEEMWGAEGKLRGVEPRKALPFEYRALTLLKQVQQRSRLYVQKIGFEAPVLYPEEKRLSGDLEGIRNRRRQSAARQNEELSGVRRALAALRSSSAVDTEAVLAGAREGSKRLAERAREDPGLDLEGLESLRRWITDLEGGPSADDATRSKAATALWSLLPVPEVAPSEPTDGASGVAAAYRRRLADPGSR